jgi:hypothetical protein
LECKNIETGLGELDQTKLPIVLSSMFQSQAGGIAELVGMLLTSETCLLNFNSIYINKLRE